MCQKIHLYPSNWLYNAGVVGFLRVLEFAGKGDTFEFKDDGSVEIEKKYFNNLLTQTVSLKNGFNICKLAYQYLLLNYEKLIEDKDQINDDEKIKRVWGKLFNVYYRGFFNANSRQLYQKNKKGDPPLIDQFSFFVSNMLNSNSVSGENCSFCLSSDFNFNYKNSFTSEHNKLLGASLNEVPNSFWNLNQNTSLNICDFCCYILIHHHLALTKLLDDSEIFINAPSFKLMWYLNNYSSIFKATTIGQYKEILGMSLIEMASKFYIQLSRWEKMNIEIVSKYKVYDKNRKKYIDKIDFFSLPAEIVDLLTNKEIVSLLIQIGEFKILNMVLDGKFKDILNFAEKILRISLKDERTKSEEDFINTNIKLDRNKQNLTEFSQKLFKLYALIEREIKKEVI